MPPTPNITLTATLDDIAGVAAGSTGNPARLRIALCGYGPQLPRVGGAQLTITQSKYTSSGGVQSIIFTVTLPTGASLPAVGGDVLLAGLTTSPGLSGKSYTVTAASTSSGLYYVTISPGSGNVNQANPVTETGTMTEAGVMVAKVGPFDFYDTGSGITTALWGNDQITPSGTFYEIAVIDGQEDVLQCAAYQFTGTQEIDLSDAVPITPPYPLPVPSLHIAPCSGAVPGTVYSAPGNVVAVFVNGVLQRPTTDYTLSGQTITLVYTTQTGDNVNALVY